MDSGHIAALCSWCNALVPPIGNETTTLEWAMTQEELRGLLLNLCCMSGEDVRLEHFSHTPPEMFREMLAVVEMRRTQQTSTVAWQNRRLQRAKQAASHEANVEDEDAGHANGTGVAQAKGPPDPDGFVPPLQRLPKGHAIATAHAEIVLLDRTRALLDMHYDSIYYKQWFEKEELRRAKSGDAKEVAVKTVPRRPHSHKVDPRVVEYQTTPRYETLALPEEAKRILQRPADEGSWGKLQEIATLMCDQAGGVVNATIMDGVARTDLERVLNIATGEVGEDVMLGDVMLSRGWRVVGALPSEQPPVQIKVQRPGWGTVPLSTFGLEVFRNNLKHDPESLQKLMRSSRAGNDATRENIESVANSLLLDLGMCLWHAQVWKWHRVRKAWTSEAKLCGAIQWYLEGQHVGEKPVFDGICARCGELLFGTLSVAGSNKCNGEPRNVNGHCTSDDAQPPFLLRWVPAFYAQTMPDVFAYSANSNKLVLQEEHRNPPPWKTALHGR